MNGLKRLIRRTMRALGFDGVRLGRYLLVMRLGGEADAAALEADPLERYVFEQRLSETLQRLEISCILDVGANQGQYGLMLRRIGYAGHIISFEPVGEAFQALQAVASQDAKWTAYQWALGAETTHAQIHVSRSSAFSSFLTPTAYSVRRFRDSAPVERVEEVEVHRLDEILLRVESHIEHPRIFLKMDTQGYDLQVFAGAGSETQRVLGLQSEVAVVPLYEGAPTMVEALRVYEAQGFDLAGLFPVCRDPDSARVLEYDCLLLRSSSLGEGKRRATPPRARAARAP